MLTNTTILFGVIFLEIAPEVLLSLILIKYFVNDSKVTAGLMMQIWTRKYLQLDPYVMRKMKCYISAVVAPRYTVKRNSYDFTNLEV